MANVQKRFLVFSVFNARLYLDACVESFRARIIRNLQAFFAEDASYNGSARFLESVAFVYARAMLSVVRIA